MQELVEKMISLSEFELKEAEDTYKNEVEVDVYFLGSGLDDKYAKAPDNVELEFDINVEYRSWGIKDIDVFLRGVLEFEVVVRSDLPDEEDKEVVIPVKIDFIEVDAKINWMPGSGYAPAEIHVGIDGEEVKEVEVDFYYLKP